MSDEPAKPDAQAITDQIAELIKQLPPEQTSIEGAFEPIKETVTSALGELAEALRDFSAAATGAIESASQQIADLASAVDGADGLDDALNRVTDELGIKAEAPDPDAEAGAGEAVPKDSDNQA